MTDLESMTDDELRAVAGVQSKPATQPLRQASPQQFASDYYRHIAPVAARLRVSPEVLAAQFGLETGWGANVIPGTNNLGNIKDFSGSGVAATDSMTGSKDRYRQYASPADFMNDYATLIEKRYPKAIGAGDDPVRFARALKAGGYAEDPAYIRKVADARKAVPKYDDLEHMSDAELRDIAGLNDPMPNFSDVKGGVAKSEPGLLAMLGKEAINSAPAQAISGGLSGVGRVVSGVQFLGDKLTGGSTADLVTGQTPRKRYEQRNADLDRQLQSVGVDTEAFGHQVGRVGGEILSTTPVVKLAGVGLKALGAGRLGSAVASGGMTTGTTVPAGISAAGAKDLAIRRLVARRLVVFLPAWLILIPPSQVL